MAFVENAPEVIVAAAKELLEKGLVEGTSGNISARMEDGNIAVTPSSLDYRIMTPEDIVVVNPAGDVVSGERGPTSEKYLHLAEQVVKALENRGAALIANHGMVAIGTTMEKTMHNTALVERSAKIIWGAKQLGGIFPLPEKVNQNFMNVYPFMR